MSLTIADYERILTAGMTGVTVHGKITQGNGYISAVKPLTYNKNGGTWAEDVGAMGQALENDFAKLLSEIEQNSVGIVTSRRKQKAQIAIDRAMDNEIILFVLGDVYTKPGSSLGNDKLSKIIREAARKVGLVSEVVVK